MDEITRAILLSWEWRVVVLLPLFLFAALYTLGWRRLRRRARRPQRLANGWRLTAYLVGVFLVGLALLSPIDVLAGQFFFMHMVQHLLLVMIAPPLLMLGNPMPFLLWGLPRQPRRRVGAFLSRLLHRDAASRRYLRTATSPGVVWLVYIGFLIGWHDPDAYNLALRNDFVHDIEHLTFFLPAMLYWWHVVGAGPHIHKQFSVQGRIVFLIATIPPTMFTGIAIAFSREVLYKYYLAVPRVWGIDVLGDQIIGGVIMWVPGSMMYIIAVLILTARWLQNEERKPPLPVARWSTEERMAMPGLDK
jgi:cytochrome c oxidase assembly factor CtaG